MFVTSDIFDLQKIAQWRNEPWRECLMGGVSIHGTHWPGPEAAARFLCEAANLCGLTDELKYAGYSAPRERRIRSIAPKSMARLAQGKLPGAMHADCVFVRGEHKAVGLKSDYLYFGGGANGYDRDAHPDPTEIGVEKNRHLWAYFYGPISEDFEILTSELLKLAARLLEAEYGYGFVRDDFCFVEGYVSGIPGPLDYQALSNRDADEIHGWRQFGRRALWSKPWPMLRDLFQVNLLSERHTAKPVDGLGYLAEWILNQPGRGRLEEIGDGRLLWWLKDAELVNVRPLLNHAGLLVTCHDRVYRDLPGGAAVRPA